MTGDQTATPPYVTDDETAQSLQAWLYDCVARPDIFVIAPAIRDVGENQLVSDLADASYRLANCHDARRRHLMSRAFPAYGTTLDYHRFIDEAFRVSEITDEFVGVDNIDLTSWLDKDIDQSTVWHFLVQHVQAHPETDFVFCAYTDDTKKAEKLIRRIFRDTGLALQTVVLRLPSPSMLAAEFQSQSNGEFGDCAAYVLSKFENLQKADKPMNYGFARACATHALHLLSVKEEKLQVLDEAFDRYSHMAYIPTRKLTIGF